MLTSHLLLCILFLHLRYFVSACFCFRPKLCSFFAKDHVEPEVVRVTVHRYCYCGKYLGTVCLKTDGTTTGQDGASLPQLAAISSPYDETGWTVDNGSTGQPDR